MKERGSRDMCGGDGREMVSKSAVLDGGGMWLMV